MDNLKYYLLFNPELKKLNMKELKENYLDDMKTNNRVTSVESFFKKYKDFNIDEYKKLNDQLKNSSKLEILIHKNINEINSINNNINYHLINISNKTINQTISKTINKTTNKKENIIKCAHIFVHFFKIGGGESYIYNFNKYNDGIFEETIFLNNNYVNETLFNFNCKIIYYNNYSELNKFLNDYDIIIDHQLYWFPFEISKEAFLNIKLNKIIRIIHGVPIHFTDITSLNFYYSIELYTEYLSHNSWNNHIKIYNNIGVKKKIFTKEKYDEENIKVAIIGRINIEKIPIIFLNKLLSFSKIYKKYTFNFYGVIEQSYFKNFNNIINRSSNLIYHGVIDPKEMDLVYLNNNILLHPSKFEAGATVVLEAMSYGLPIICRNIGGLSNATGNNNFLCNNENEMFEKLLLINNSNYDEISKINILKIENENDEEYLTNKLYNDLKIIYKYENSNEIPNVIHYIYGLEKQSEPFSFVFYLSIYSNFLINNPDVIYFHYQYLPYGIWWDEAKKYLKINYINCDNISWGNKKILKFAHKADKIRLEMLLKYGGIYMDIDTISYKSYKYLLNYDFVIGIQEENYGKENITLYCNAILFSKKNNIFIKKWINEYEKYFLPNGWCEASVHLPNKIYNSLSFNDKSKIKILSKEHFYYPSYNETDKIFENDLNINEELVTLHLWNTFSKKYFKEINDFEWMNSNNSLYAKLMNYIYNFNK